MKVWVQRSLGFVVGFAIGWVMLAIGASIAKADTAIVVATCGTPPATYGAGQNRPMTMNTDGEVCNEVTGTITPSGTQDVNVTQVGSNAVVTGGTNGALGVGGLAASSATVVGNPVFTGGQYLSTLPSNIANGEAAAFQTDRNGNLRARTVGTSITGADGASNSLAGVIGRDEDEPTARMWAQANFLSNGTTWDRNFTCPSSAVINVAAAATTELVPLTSSQVIRVCSFVITGDTAATTATFVYGTGSNCASGTTSLTGAMRMVDEGNISLSGMNGSLFRTIASNALCLTAATGTVSGFVTYAKY